jgi:hypothetical protein
VNSIGRAAVTDKSKLETTHATAQPLAWARALSPSRRSGVTSNATYRQRGMGHMGAYASSGSSRARRLREQARRLRAAKGRVLDVSPRHR